MLRLCFSMVTCRKISTWNNQKDLLQKGRSTWFANQIKVEIENNKQMPKIKMSSEDLVYKRISHQKVSNYILLLFHK